MRSKIIVLLKFHALPVCLILPSFGLIYLFRPMLSDPDPSLHPTSLLHLLPDWQQQQWPLQHLSAHQDPTTPQEEEEEEDETVRATACSRAGVSLHAPRTQHRDQLTLEQTWFWVGRSGPGLFQNHLLFWSAIPAPTVQHRSPGSQQNPAPSTSHSAPTSSC